jgi:chromosomal replication initiation ATPase DnaA
MDSLKGIVKIVDKLIGTHGSENVYELLSNYEVDGNGNIHKILVDYVDYIICQYYQYENLSIYKNSSVHKVAESRSIAYYVLYRLGGISLNKIAEFYQKETSTISRSVNRIEEIVKNPRFNLGINADVDFIKTKFEQYLSTQLKIQKNGKNNN